MPTVRLYDMSGYVANLRTHSRQVVNTILHQTSCIKDISDICRIHEQSPTSKNFSAFTNRARPLKTSHFSNWQGFPQTDLWRRRQKLVH